jgi:cobalt/nickel transport system permease protein
LAFLKKPEACLLGLACSMLLAFLAGWEQPLTHFKNLLLLNSFLIFIWLILPFSFAVPGQKIMDLGPFKVTKEGLNLAVLLSLKALAITLAAMSFTTTTPIFDLLIAVRSLGTPEKLTTILFLMMRYIDVIGQEYHRLSQAMKIRGFKARLNLHSLKSLAYLSGLLLIRGLERSERVHAAMRCRGYKGCLWLDKTFKFNNLDFRLSLMILFLATVVLFLNAL